MLFRSPPVGRRGGGRCPRYLSLRESTRGPLRVDIAHQRVWVWDDEEAAARCWHLVVRHEVGAPKKIKYSLSNALADTPLERLAQMQGERDWVERAFEDATADRRSVGTSAPTSYIGGGGIHAWSLFDRPA